MKRKAWIISLMVVMVLSLCLLCSCASSKENNVSKDGTSTNPTESVYNTNTQVSTKEQNEKETEMETEPAGEQAVGTSEGATETTAEPTTQSIEAGTQTSTEVSTQTSTETSSDNSTDVPTDTETETPTQTNIELSVTEVKGYSEFIKLEFENVVNATYKIGYKKSGTSGYIYNTDTCVKLNDNVNRYEITALPAGTYDVLITKTTTEGSVTKKYEGISVAAIDRSGYAHFNSSNGVGAYNADGSLKSNVIILDLTNTNKNTITATFAGKKYVGIANILGNLSKSQYPVLIRVHGRVSTNQWNYKAVVPRLADDSNLISTHFENTFSKQYGENIANLTLRLKDAKTGVAYNYTTTATGIVRSSDTSTSKKTTTYTRNVYSNLKGKTVYDDDSSYNCINIKGAKNVTIEGVGTDAEIFQWGMSFNDSHSIEIKNLTFTDYPEDALNFMSSSTNLDANSRYWVHHNTFNVGKNNWDLTGEQDKDKGDGALDINNISYITVSYNVFNQCGKTGLVGSSDTSSAKNVTFHHNYYNGVSSRLPLGRGANMHMYNNYYYNCSSCLSIRANGYVFSESNYFENCKNAHKTTVNATYPGAAIKSYNDYFKNTTGVSSQKVSDRTQYVTNSCKPDGVTDYSRFDVNAGLFYYDSVNKKTDVSVMTELSDVPAYVKKYAGVSGKYQ